MHPSDYIAITAIVASVAVAAIGGLISVLHRFVRRVHALEVTINNGLCTKVNHIELLVGEIRQHFMWDGRDRRTDDE